MMPIGFGFLLFTVGILFGVALNAIWAATMKEVKDTKHEETVVMQGQEIARLRAQVALIIGKER